GTQLALRDTRSRKGPPAGGPFHLAITEFWRRIGWTFVLHQRPERAGIALNHCLRSAETPIAADSRRFRIRDQMAEEHDIRKKSAAAALIAESFVPDSTSRSSRQLALGVTRKAGGKLRKGLLTA